jgi:hypothetical protein
MSPLFLCSCYTDDAHLFYKVKKKRGKNHLLKALVISYRDFLRVVFFAFQNKVLVNEPWYCNYYILYEGNATTSSRRLSRALYLSTGTSHSMPKNGEALDFFFLSYKYLQTATFIFLLSLC